MRKAIIFGAIFLGLAGSAQAVTLVDSTGSPIGGQLQAYADTARVPTLAGTLTVLNAAGECPIACSQGPYKTVESDGSLWVNTPIFGPTTTWAAPGVSGYQFDWELGHQFDWAYLTDDDRQAFATMWRDPTGEWWDSVKALNGGGEDGLERVFAADYASCAMGYVPQAVAEPANPEQVCELIDTIGQRVGAHMPPPLPPTAGVTTITGQAASHAGRPHREHHPRRHARRATGF